MPLVWIDPGHGGEDPGALNKNLNLQEKRLALKVALEVEKKLKENGVDVIMTRRDDKTLNYIQRYQLENANDCNLAISIHLNSCAIPNSASGCEIWIHSKAHHTIKRWANNMIKRIAEVKGTNIRGVKQGFPGKPNADFWVNRLTKSNSMLIELGFINSDHDATLINGSYKEYARAIAMGVCDELGKKYVDNVKPNVYDFEINNLNDINLAFLLGAKMETGERFEDFLIRQGFRFKLVKRK